MTKIQKALFEITRQFVDEVQKPMIDKYLEMLQIPEQKYMIETLLTRYDREKEKADKDEIRNFENYLTGNKYNSLKYHCLIHEDHFKQIIIDFLQGRE